MIRTNNALLELARHGNCVLYLHWLAGTVEYVIFKNDNEPSTFFNYKEANAAFLAETNT